MSFAVSESFSPASPSYTPSVSTEDRKVHDAASCALASPPSQPPKLLWEMRLRQWTRQLYPKENKLRALLRQQIREKAVQRILAYLDQPNGTLDLTDLSDFDDLPLYVFDLPHLQRLLLNPTSAGSMVCNAVVDDDVMLYEKTCRFFMNIKKEDYDIYFDYIGQEELFSYVIERNSHKICAKLVETMTPALLNRVDPRIDLPPLRVALQHRALESCKILCKAGADPFCEYKGQSALQYAVYRSELPFVEALLTNPLPKGAAATIVSLLFGLIWQGTPYNSQRAMPLIHILLKPLQNHPDLNLNSGGSKLLLMTAQRPFWHPILPLLLKAGADIKGLTEQDESLLLLLVKENAPEAIFSFVLEWVVKEYPALLNQQNRLGDTPLMWAIQKDHFVSLLLDKKADPNQRNSRGVGPLDWAAALGNLSLCKQLVSHGACYNKNLHWEGELLPDFLFRKGKTEIAYVLEPQGTERMQKALQGPSCAKRLIETAEIPADRLSTPLKIASSCQGRTLLQQLLLENPDLSPLTELDKAALFGTRDECKALRAHGISYTIDPQDLPNREIADLLENGTLSDID